MNDLYVSLCIPTNGVIEWIFPVLDSIYSQGVDESLYEVVISDNGRNYEFKKLIKEYISKHSNIVYVEDLKSPLFLSEPVAYKNAKGKLIKFVNHRTKLCDGTLNKLIEFVKNNEKDKPIIYYCNGVAKWLDKYNEYNSFDEFVKNLSYLSTWSTGMAIWKEDFDSLLKTNPTFNELFPHTTVLFSERNRNKYIIDNSIIFDEIPQGRRPKGSYDVFYAFGVEYPNIILKLYKDKDISYDTLKYVLDKELDFIANMYIDFFILKRNYSYDLSGYKDMLNIFYTNSDIHKRVLINFVKRSKNKTVKILTGNKG